MLADDLYQDTRSRIAGLVTDATDFKRSVPACPGWSVRDVLAHMTAVAQDWADRSLTGAPTDEQTAEHVTRFADLDNAQLLGAFAAAADRLHQLAQSNELEPPLGDIACHEHDIRAAIDRPGARDSESVRWTAHRLLSMLTSPVPLRVVVEGGEYRSGPHIGHEIVLRTTLFESLRWRTGRRSIAQLARMDWSADPAPVLNHLCLFGPATQDVLE